MKEIIKIIKQLNELPSKNKKIEILKENKNNKLFCNILSWTYNPYIKFYVSSKNLIKNKELNENKKIDDTLYEVLLSLSNRFKTGHDAIKLCLNFLNNKDKEYTELFYNILDKNLKCRIDVKLINSAIPGLIPEFSVALAKRFEEYNKFKIKDGWLVSRKMDGLRCVVVIDCNGVVELFSRTGNQFLTMDVLKKEFERLKLKNKVFDGEVCIVDEQGNENFAAIMKEYNKKNHIIKNPKYLIFDYLDLNNFIDKKSKEKLSERLKKLNDLKISSKNISILKQIKLKDEKHLELLKNTALKKSWEGLIIRKDCEYQGKRSNDILKHKLFKDSEFKVVGIEVSKIRHLVNGKDIEENMIKGLVINYKKEKITVGSGLSMDQRLDWYKYPKKIIGKIITVKYFEETDNQKGTNSLRFPTLLCVYEDGETRIV